MAGLILFETTESVIEILWDIALAVFIIRISLVYFLLAFTTGTLASYLLCTRLLPVNHLTTPQSELAVAPVMLILAAVWARAVIVYFEIPRVRGFRLAIGGLAAALLALSEAAVALVLYEEGVGGWILETDRKAGAVFGALLLAYGLMPTMLMALERRSPYEVAETTHGHEKKSVLNAVPTVNMTGKKGTKAD
jgi:hypothetical protein